MKEIHIFFKTFLLLTVLTGYFLSRDHASAGTQDYYPIGQLVALEGDAFYAGSEKKAKIRVDDPIYFNSMIETGPKSKAMIMFIDDTQITLGENSTLKIDEYVFDPYDSSENKGRFSFAKGTFLWVSGMISKREKPDVRLDTAYGSIGIRGTVVWAGPVSDAYGVFTDEGQVHFQGEWGTADLAAGDGILVNMGKINREKEKWEPEAITSSFERVTFKRASSAGWDDKINEIKRENIRRRHDYRGRMFPYKENPLRPRLKGKDDKFFSDEFEELRNKN